MLIKYLGTAAAEGIPAIFCQCDVCRKARKLGGRNIRTRSQALVDGKLLLDFNADTYMHVLNYGIELAKIGSCLVTHSHSDHLYPAELGMRDPIFAHHKDAPEKIKVYGSGKVAETLNGYYSGRACDYAEFIAVKPYESFDVEGYAVTALPAVHDPKSGPFVYIIEKDGKTFLYGHDSGIYEEPVWEWLAANIKHFDAVSLDCTEANKRIDYPSHSNVERDVYMKKRMTDMGIADESTKFILNHFSHNGGDVNYDDFIMIAEPLGFIVSYDGMEITL